MAKIKNNFLKATVNKDFDERLTPNGQMTDAENVMVTSEDNGNVGVLKNVKGNIKTTSLNIPNSETIGSLADDANDRCFYFVTSPTYDYVIEYNLIDNTTQIVLQSTSSTGVLNFNSSYRISHYDLFVSDEGGDLLSWTDGLNPPRIVSINRAKTYPIDGFTDTEISVMKPSPIFAPLLTLSLSNTEISTNFLEDKFLQFAYRYKYEDGHYSAISSWSQVAFLPSSFNLDYQTYENLGMVNLANSVNIGFNSGSRHVIGIDLLFRESDSSTVYVIDKFIKEDEGWINENEFILYNFYGNKIYSVLDESQFFRNFDNVPLTALTQQNIGNRLLYSNFVEGRDIDSTTKLDVDYVSSSLVLDRQEGIVTAAPPGNIYSNVVDFENFTEVTGISNQMDFLSNVLKLRLDDVASSSYVRNFIKITPKAEYTNVEYSLYIQDGSTILESFTGLTGINDLIYDRAFSEPRSADLTFYVVSDAGLIYDLELEYNIYNVFGLIINSYEYFADDQLCYPNSSGYDSTWQGDTVIDYNCTFDFSNVDFTSGNQFRFEIQLQSSLSYDTKPELTYFYNLTEDYTDLDDFITNSNFVQDIQSTFSNSFINGTNPPYPFVSGAGTIISSSGFIVSTLGDTLTIRPPYVNYDVTEPTGVEELKDDFYLVREIAFAVYSEDSFASMHSNRDYTCDIIYLDKEGRKTTVISGGETAIYIPSEESENVNKLRINTSLSTPPSWAKYYKFAIKETKRNYSTIFGNIVYTDGIYRWIQLVGENKNKVKEGDILVLKSDYSGIVETTINVKVLEVTTQPKDFIEGNVNQDNELVLEDGGLYFKIKQGNFDININGDSFVTYEGFLSRYYASRSNVYTAPLFGEFDNTNTFVPTIVKAGTQIRFFVRLYTFKSGGFDDSIEIIKFANNDYDSVREWWIAEVANNQSWLNFADRRLADYNWEGDERFYVRSAANGGSNATSRSDMRVNVVFDINYASGSLIFENYEKEQLDSIYYESVETYNIVNGSYNSGNILDNNIHILGKTFNCFTFGNGCESNTIKDSFSGNKFYINSNPTSVTEDAYRQVNRYADLTYSGVYQESTNVNKLNEFNLSLANYKDDLDKLYGPVIRLDSDGTDLLVIQQDKWSKVLYGKDLLYNADATTNLSRIENVLGQQVVYAGEYGISYHPESFDDYGTNSFASDIKRGVILRFNDSNGLTEISNSGLRDYFKTLFRDNTIINIISQYDSFFDVWIMNIKYTINGKDYSGLDESYDYVTWVYSPEVGGFLGKQTFNPDSMLRVNNEFLSFKGSDVYKHNIGDYSTFYDVFYPISFEFNFNEDPSSRKIFKNVSIEGNSAWNVSLKTDLQDGYVNQSDFVDKEGVNYGYIRGNNSLDLATIAVTGLGLVNEINTLTSEILLNEIPSYISVGDLVYNTSLVLIGTITGITSSSIVLSSFAGLSVGQFILSSKPSSVETSGIRGYYMNTRFSLQPSQYVEVYAVNSEVVKSFE